jgi:hypothetical protein
MASLDTVAKFVTRARVLLQDTLDAPYRYSDTDLVEALNMAFLEARRLRPDLFLDTVSLPNFSANDSTAVDLDEQYRVAFVYYMVGHIQLQDDEATQDARAGAFLAMFRAQLTSLA